MIPAEPLGIYNSNESDNANDALKESEATWEKHLNILRDNNMHEETMAHGLSYKLILLCDAFHIHQLAIKHMSEECCGKTGKGKHDQVHHRQVSNCTGGKNTSPSNFKEI